MNNSSGGKLPPSSQSNQQDFLLSKTRGVLRVSVGFDRFEGDYLEFIADWMCSKGITNQLYLIGDTLQRFNLMWREKLSRETALEESRLAGTRWIARHVRLFEKVQKRADHSLSISRWDEWLNHESFPNHCRDICDLFREDKGFQESIDADIHRFVQNRPNAAELLGNQDFMTLSRDFLLEEIAVHELVLEDFRGRHFYPGCQLKSEMYIQSLGDSSLFPMLQNDIFVKIPLRVAVEAA